MDVPNESALSLEDALKDDFRVNYYDGYISNMGIAMQNGGKDEEEYCNF